MNGKKNYREAYEDLRQVFGQILSEGSLQTPTLETQAALERHGLLAFKRLSPNRLAEIAEYLKQPMGNEEFATKARADLEDLVRECFDLQTVVHEAIRWSLGVSNEKKIREVITKFLLKTDPPSRGVES